MFLLYAFLRVWLRNILIAIVTVAITVKIQMFHSGISPLVWNFPQDTPVRHWLDIPVFYCLWRHASRFQDKYLMCSGLGVVSPCLGIKYRVMLAGSVLGYLIFLLIFPENKSFLASNYEDIRRISFYFLMPLAVMGGVFFLMQGMTILAGNSGRTLLSPCNCFYRGWVFCLFIPVCMTGIFSRLSQGLWFRWFMDGPWQSSQPVLFQEITSWRLIPGSLCLYGLCLYVHYLARASTSHYYAVGIPVVMVIGFWLSKLMQKFKLLRALQVSLF